MAISTSQLAVCQNLVPLVNIKIAGKWMFIPPKMVLIDIDPYPHEKKKELPGSPGLPQAGIVRLWLSLFGLLVAQALVSIIAAVAHLPLNKYTSQR